MTKIKFDKTEGLIKIAAKVSGSEKKDYGIILAIDTGSYLTTLRPEVLTRIGFPATNEQVLLIGVSESIRVNLAQVSKLSVAGIAVENYKVANHNLSSAYDIDGVLGNDFLRQHKICIDFPNGIISIE